MSKPCKLACAMLLSVAPFTIPANADPITHVDQAGRSQTFETTPKNIVAVTGASNIITLDRSADKLAAASPRSRNTLLEGVLASLYPSLQDLPSNILSKDGTPNIEEMLNLEADLAIEWARKGKNIDAMERAGIPVVAMKYAKVGMEKTFLTDVGHLLRQDQRAADILAWHQDVYARITERTNALPSDQKPRALFLLRETYAAGPASHFQFTMDTAGARNALDVDANFVEIDVEMMLNANPDVIWLMGWNPKLTTNMFDDNPVLADIPAIKNHRVYKVPVGGDHWDAPNQEFPLSWEWFTRTIHPNLLDGSLRENIREAYPLVYGFTPTDKQLDQILRVKENGNSADYDLVVR